MDTLKSILETRIIAISRGNYGERLLRAAGALQNGGITAVEVTFEQNRKPELTAEAIAALSARFAGSMAVGAGTVTTLEQLELAYRSGASYIVSPNVDTAVIRAAKERGLVSIPGAMTPTEILTADGAGADIVKLFPAGMLGAEYFKAVRAPMPNIRLAAVAGITPDNIGTFLRAGACAFGISSGLFLPRPMAEERYSEIEAAAKHYMTILNNK